MSSITKSVMQPLGVAIFISVLILEFSKMAKKIANSGGAMTFEALAPMLISYIMVAVVIYQHYRDCRSYHRDCESRH